MARLSLTLRALLLVPLLAVGVDLARATVACGGQALLAGALGDPGALGGGWAELPAFCAAAGALLALALRVAPAAERLVRSLRPPAPRLILAGAASYAAAPPAWQPPVRFALARRERGPPAPLD